MIKYEGIATKEQNWVKVLLGISSSTASLVEVLRPADSDCWSIGVWHLMKQEWVKVRIVSMVRPVLSLVVPASLVERRVVRGIGLKMDFRAYVFFLRVRVIRGGNSHWCLVTSSNK